MSNPQENQPVPDPERTLTKAEFYQEKTVEHHVAVLKLTARVDQLEKDMQETRGVAGAVWKRDSLSMNELKSKLRQTIEAVKKLAKGKSLGALGLPSEEEWDQGL